MQGHSISMGDYSQERDFGSCSDCLERHCKRVLNQPGHSEYRHPLPRVKRCLPCYALLVNEIGWLGQLTYRRPSWPRRYVPGM